MPEKARPCPKCGGMMNYRLGEFQCGSCAYSELAAAPQKEEHKAGGIQRREAWQPGLGSTISGSHSGYTGKLLVPPDASGSQAGASPSAYGEYEAPPPPPPPGTVYGQASWERAEPSAFSTGGAQSSLQQEKTIFMWILGALGLLNILFSIASATLQGSINQALSNQPASGNYGNFPEYTAGDATGSVIVVIAQVLASVLLVGVALYGQTIWLKWCCLGCQSFGLLLIIIGGIVILATLGTLSLATSQIPGGGMLITFVGILVVLQIGIQGWFISLIYRDIKERQYG